MALEVNRAPFSVIRSQGITLVDFKMEFGRQGKMILDRG